MEQILNANADPVRLVRIRGPDSAPRGTEFVLAERGFVDAVEHLRVRRNHVRVGGNAQVRGVHAARFQFLNFAD